MRGGDWGRCHGCGRKGTITDDLRADDARCFSCRRTRTSCCASDHAAQAKCGEVFTSSTSLAFSMAARNQHEAECPKCAATPEVP